MQKPQAAWEQIDRPSTSPEKSQAYRLWMNVGWGASAQYAAEPIDVCLHPAISTLLPPTLAGRTIAFLRRAEVHSTGSGRVAALSITYGGRDELQGPARPRRAAPSSSNQLVLMHSMPCARSQLQRAIRCRLHVELEDVAIATTLARCFEGPVLLLSARR